MKLKLDCENALYGANMRIICKVDGGLCGFQRFKPCKGWSVLTEGSATCLRRTVKKSGKKTVKKHSDNVRDEG